MSNFGALDANDVVWDDFDPSDSRNTRERLVRVTHGLRERQNGAEPATTRPIRLIPAIPTNRVRLLFSFAKADQRPKFQDTMTKAIKKLIALSGRRSANTIFSKSIRTAIATPASGAEPTGQKHAAAPRCVREAA